MCRLLLGTTAWLLVLAGLIAGPLPSRAERIDETDEQTLTAAGLSTDGASLLAAVRKHIPTAGDRDKIRGLISQLGNEQFRTREKATHDLFALGRISLPQLQEARKDDDAEVARRARSLIERIEGAPACHLPVAAVRLLAVRKPADSVEALLGYLPHAENEELSGAVRQSLIALALRDDKLDPVLRRALTDARAETRAAAAEALIRGAGEQGRSIAAKLLTDAAPVVRLRVALALAFVKEREGIPVLIDLLGVLPADRVNEVEAVLYQLAGDSAPNTPTGTEPAQRKECRDAWASWWKVNAGRVDLGRLKGHPSLGYTLICDAAGNRVYEIDRQGKERWSIKATRPVDAWVLPGNRVLVAEHNSSSVTEYDFTGKIVWSKNGVGFSINARPLANGNIFIAAWKGPIMEVDRAGKEVYTIPNVTGDTLAAYRTRQGTILCTTFTGQCLTLDTTGKQLKSFHSGQDGSMSGGGIDLLANGHILITRVAQHKVVEFDREGKVLREVDVPATTATALPNGHILVASRGTHRVFELDRAGKVVWEYKGAGDAFRARRR